MEGNPDPMDLTIVVGAEGGIRMICNSECSPAGLQTGYSAAEMVYRVRRQGNAVRLEGRAGSRTCLFESRTLNGAASGSSRGYGECSPAISPDRLLRPLLPPAWDLPSPRLLPPGEAVR
jgi:hypothetical protein